MTWETSTRARRLPPGWKKLRAAILERDGHQCTRVTDGGRCTIPATEVDHIEPGDNHNPTNLASLCGPHHAEKTKREAAQARRRHRDKRAPEPHPGLR